MLLYTDQGQSVCLTHRQESPQQVQPGVRVLVAHRVHLGGEQVSIAARLQDVNHLDRPVQLTVQRNHSLYLVQRMDDVAGLVLLGGQDDVDHLGDGRLYREGIVFTTWRSLYQ